MQYLFIDWHKILKINSYSRRKRSEDNLIFKQTSNDFLKIILHSFLRFYVDANIILRRISRNIFSADFTMRLTQHSQPIKLDVNRYRHSRSVTSEKSNKCTGHQAEDRSNWRYLIIGGEPREKQAYALTNLPIEPTLPVFSTHKTPSTGSETLNHLCFPWHFALGYAIDVKSGGKISARYNTRIHTILVISLWLCTRVGEIST